MRKRRLKNPERRVDICFHGPVELISRDVGNGFMALLSARVAYHNIETAQASNRFGHQPLAKSLLPKIAGNWDANAALPSDEIDDFARVGFFGGQEVDSDVGAFARVSYRRCTAHS